MSEDSTLTGTQAKQMVTDPFISKFNPLCHFGAISEKMTDSMRTYLKKDSMMKKVEDEAAKAPKYNFPLIDEEDFK